MLLNDDTAYSSVYIEIIIRQILLIIGSINVITHACFGLRKQHVYCPSKNSIHNVIDEYRAGKIGLIYLPCLKNGLVANSKNATSIITVTYGG